MPTPPELESEPPLAHLLGTPRRLITSRPAVLALGILGRLGVKSVWTMWPDWRNPRFTGRLADRTPARFIGATVARGSRRRFPGPVTRIMLRAGGAMIVSGQPVAVEAAERALDRRIQHPRVAVYAPSGVLCTKANCMVWEADSEAPVAVVKIAPERHIAHRLRYETEIVEAIRERLDANGEVADGLPLAPLYAGEVEAEYAVVQAFDPLAATIGGEGRDRAFAWLRAFQAATTSGVEPWSGDDQQRWLDVVRRAWEQAELAGGARVVGTVAKMLEPLHGTPIPRPALHGDFCRANLASGPLGLRVYDWEWAKPTAPPFFDFWTYDLAELRDLVDAELESSPERLAELLRGAMKRVEAELAAVGLDPRFALAQLAPAIGELTFRCRWEIACPAENEPASIKVMAAAEALVLGAA